MNINKIKYFFYYKIENKVVYMRTLLNKYYLSDSDLKTIFNLNVREIDYNNDSDIKQWCDVVNNAYDDCNYNTKSAYEMLMNHIFLMNTRTFLFYTNSKRNENSDSNTLAYKKEFLCASVSIGTYKDNENVGGIFRLACMNKFKGNHFGNAILLYALSQLQKCGLEICEDIVSSKRDISLQMHMNLGFEPLYDWHYATYKKNLKNVNLIQKIRLYLKLKASYRKHVKLLNYRAKI